MKIIKALSELDRGDLALAGGKGANLGALIRAGLPVPEGFCVTTPAYLRFVEANGLQEKIERWTSQVNPESPQALDEASAAIRKCFEDGEIPVEIADDIYAAYRRLRSLDGIEAQVAVRSSATAEDLPNLSFAGQQDTYLNLLGEEAVLQSVLRCWASLWTARAIGYRIRNQIPNEGIALAVVVQCMVQSESSGVLFTANPLTGKRTETVIDATFGLGEALVSGAVEPDHYVVRIDAGTWKILNKTLGSKALVIQGKADGGTTITQGDTSTLQALADEQIID
ncbi:MAG: phosphoenolpyruvate synthase, partial [Anaerolineaceae bacterium]|nr:phosphoenolpyruvate synthase [Anaerolineaceae bacterium]